MQKIYPSNGASELNNLLTAIENEDITQLQGLLGTDMKELLSYVDLFKGDIAQMIVTQKLTSIRNPSLVHLAVWFSAHTVLKFLLQNGYEDQIEALTEEGLTPLHLAAAVGDYISVDILLNNGAIPLITDKLGRVPLHYGIQTDMRVAVLLCAGGPKAIQLADRENKTPLDLAMESNNRLAAEYCAAMLRLNSDEESVLNMHARMTAITLNKKIKESAMWIPHHLRAPLCTEPLKVPAGQTGYCQCNMAYQDHPVVTRNPVLARRLRNAPNRFVNMPTDTFGEIEFPSNTYVSEYVRISEETKPQELIDLLRTVWAIPRPQLVLSFYGDEILSTAGKESLRKLIWKSSDSTLTWIVTDGLQRGISPMVSSAIKEYIEAYGVGLVEAVGIVPWRKVSCGSQLASESFTGRYPAMHLNTHDDTGAQEILDENVTHYLFVDTKSDPCIERTLAFRTEFERFVRISQNLYDSEPELNKTKVQICGILSGGDEATLTAIHTSVQDGMPFVLIKDTGGLADILIDCMNDTEVGERNRRKKAVTEGAQENEVFRLSPANIHQTIVSYWEFLERPEVAILMIQELLEKSEMFCICDVEEDELDYLVLLLLIGSSQDSMEDSDELNYSKLEITVALNRSDVARDKVFLSGLKWDEEKLSVYMTNFLLNDNVAFLKLFMEKGFNLKKYLTFATLERLYTYSVHAKTPRKALKNVIRRFMKLPEKISLLLIGKVLTLLLGAHYHPVYLDSQFSESEEEGENKPVPLCPATHLFIWALLTERKSTAEYLWTQLQEPLGAALMAALLLRQFAHHGESLVTKDELLEYANSYEEKAGGLLTECFTEDPHNAAQALIRERVIFGYMSCLMLAADGRSMSFISHRCSEQYLKEVWCGAIDSQATKFTFFVSMIVGIVLPPLVPFTLKFNLKTDRIRIEEGETDVQVNTSPRHGAKNITDEDANPLVSEPTSRHCRNYWEKLYAYYTAPTVRFAYTTLSHLVFLCFFTYTLMFSVPRQSTYDLKENMVLLFWVMTYFVENVRQGVMSGLSFRAYTKRIWKALELAAVFLYILGTALHLMLVAETGGRFNSMPIDPVNTVQQTLLRMADVFYGLSLFLFFYRLLEAFTADINIGPMVIMVQTMVVKDLLPFLALFSVSLVSFAILQWIVAFKNTASLNAVVNLRTLFDAMQLAYFQVFGEYNLEEIVGEGEERDSCKDYGVNCRDAMATWFSPILLGAFVILTQVLLLNLLIAMFASTYVRIEASSTGHWSLQRYHVICEFVERSPLPPPLIIFWHIYLLIKYAIRKCQKGKQTYQHPFKKSFRDQPSRERQLKHWERLRFWDYQRYVMFGRSRRKNQTTKAVSVRTTVLAGGGQGGLINQQLASSMQTFQQSTTENMQSIMSKVNRVDEVERKVDQVLKLLKTLQDEQKLIRKLAANAVQSTSASGPHSPRSEPYLQAVVKKPRFAQPHGSVRIPPLMSQDSVTSDIQSNMVVIAGLRHRIAFFVPPTSDNTPSLFASPIPWTQETESQGTTLGWKPNKFLLDDWTESEDVKASISARQIHPMGTAYAPSGNYPPPDPVTGAPRNPAGRTGVSGRGYLPFWGANPALILAVTRYAVKSTGTQPQLLFAMFNHHIGGQLPWCLVRHSKGCPGVECTRNLVDLLINTRVTECIRANPEQRKLYEQARVQYQNCKFRKVFYGFVNDMINTDNAWIEPTMVHLHFDMNLTDPSVLLRLLVPNEVTLTWTPLEEVSVFRESHKKICRDVVRSFTQSTAS